MIRLKDLLGTVLIAVAVSSISLAQNVAITFDDLPLNGPLPPGMTRVDIARDTIAILKKHHVPPTYGFINGKRIEGNADGAEALKIWTASELIGNHTYSNMDLEQNTAEAFEQDIDRNEPVLELLAKPGSDWHWLRYPYLHEGDTIEKRRAVRAYLKQHGYKIAQVTLDWEDYLWNNAYARCAAKNDATSIAWLRSSYLSTAAEFLDLGRAQAKLIYSHDIDYILLLHLGSYSSTILPDALELLRQKGFRLIRLEETEGDAAYQEDPDVGVHDAGTLLDQWMQVKQLKYPEHADKPYKQLDEICK